MKIPPWSDFDEEWNKAKGRPFARFMVIYCYRAYPLLMLGIAAYAVYAVYRFFT